MTDPSLSPHPKSRGAARRATRRGPTIDDVAEVAGVSRGTVSRVLNGGHYVSPAALRAVERAMAETGYVVNSSARSLVTRRSGAMAFVLSEPQERLFEDPNFNVLLRSCSQALADVDVSMVLMVAGTAAERARVLRYARAGHVDAVLLVSTHGGDPLVEDLQAARVPVVACGRPLGHQSPVTYVAADDHSGARLMTQHLWSSGRRRIATITGPLDTSGGVERLDGFREVLGRRAAARRIVSAADYSYRSGQVCMRRLLAQAPDLDAVFVASDLMAAGALAVLREEGRQVPDDVAVGGFDDSPVARTTEPPLTTVRQRLDLVAAEMVDRALALVDGRPVDSTIVPVELVLRGSA